MIGRASAIDAWVSRFTAPLPGMAAAVIHPARRPDSRPLLVIAGRVRTHCGFCRAAYSEFDANAVEAATWVSVEGVVSTRDSIHRCGSVLAAPVTAHLPLPAAAMLADQADTLARQVAARLLQERRALAEDTAARLTTALRVASDARASADTPETIASWKRTFLTGSREHPGVWQPDALTAWDVLDFPRDGLAHEGVSWSLEPVFYQGAERAAIIVAETAAPLAQR